MTFGQWIKIGIGAMGIVTRHPEPIARLRRIVTEDLPVIQPLIDDLLVLLKDVAPAPAPAEPQITHTEVIEKISTGNLTDGERAIMDRASQGSAS